MFRYSYFWTTSNFYYRLPCRISCNEKFAPDIGLGLNFLSKMLEIEQSTLLNRVFEECKSKHLPKQSPPSQYLQKKNNNNKSNVLGNVESNLLAHVHVRHVPLSNRYRKVNSGLSVSFNKLTSVFYASVLLLMINFVITLSKCCRSTSRRRVDLQQMHKKLTSICFLQ